MHLHRIIHAPAVEVVGQFREHLIFDELFPAFTAPIFALSYCQDNGDENSRSTYFTHTHTEEKRKELTCDRYSNDLSNFIMCL